MRICGVHLRHHGTVLIASRPYCSTMRDALLSRDKHQLSVAGWGARTHWKNSVLTILVDVVTVNPLIFASRAELGARLKFWLCAAPVRDWLGCSFLRSCVWLWLGVRHGPLCRWLMNVAGVSAGKEKYYGRIWESVAVLAAKLFPGPIVLLIEIFKKAQHGKLGCQICKLKWYK